MNPDNKQVLFFQYLKTQLPPHMAMVDEIAGILGISNDSAYRRIRGEKPIGLEEIHKLCSHFKVSMDRLLNLKSDAFLFSGMLKDDSPNSMDKWLEHVQQQFGFVNSFERRHLYYLMKDIPPFVHFQIPELAAFKFFFWMKSILHYESLGKVKFTPDDPAYEAFHSINSTLRQIEFYREAGSFKRVEDIKLLYRKVEELINHIERQAELGVKFNIGEEPSAGSAEYRLFVNELILGDNTIVAELNDRRITFLNHSVLYFVNTGDEHFNKAIYDNMKNLIKKSTLISTVGEKERVGFFNRLRNEIHHREATLR
jgi:plasmid maintenance system antidote protein VapI